MLIKLRNFSFIICLFLVACGEPVDPRVGIDTKNITLQNEQLEAVKLAEFSGQKPSVINVWATWCAPCIKEMPSLMALQKQGDYQIILINMDSKANQGTEFLAKHGFKPNISLWDKQGKIMREELSVMRLPQTFVTNKKMLIQGVEMGDKDWVSSSMLERINKYLN